MTSSQPITYTVSPGTCMPITLRVVPKATCRVRLIRDGRNDVMETGPYLSDDEGRVTIQVTAFGDEGLTTSLAVVCQSKVDLVEIPITVSLAKDGFSKTGAVDESDDLHSGIDIREGLSLDAALNLSESELFERNYPRRPDASSGDALGRWCAMVARPVRIVARRTYERLDRQAGFGASQVPMGNWCGFLLEASKGVASGTYSSVHGQWTFPPRWRPTESAALLSKANRACGSDSMVTALMHASGRPESKWM